MRALATLFLLASLMTPTLRADESVPVLQLEYRKYHITVSSSDRGTLYTVKEADGKLVADQLSAQELQAQLPEVHQFLRDAFAGDRKALLDASNRVN